MKLNSHAVQDDIVFVQIKSISHNNGKETPKHMTVTIASIPPTVTSAISVGQFGYPYHLSWANGGYDFVPVDVQWFKLKVYPKMLNRTWAFGNMEIKDLCQLSNWQIFIFFYSIDQE